MGDTLAANCWSNQELKDILPTSEELRNLIGFFQKDIAGRELREIATAMRAHAAAGGTEMEWNFHDPKKSEVNNRIVAFLCCEALQRCSFALVEQDLDGVPKGMNYRIIF